jgi:LacI family transcriptional regulator
MADALRIGLLFDSQYGYARSEIRGAIRYAREHRLQWTFAGGAPTSATRALLRKWRPHGILNATGRVRLHPSIPVVSPLTPDPSGAVTLNNAEIGRLAARHFLDRGFRHFAFVGDHGQNWSDERGHGFESDCSESDGPAERIRIPWLDLPLSGAASWRPARSRLSAWLQALPHATGLFASRDMLALEVVQAVRNLGLRIPDDIAVLGVDNDDLLCELAEPSLSSIVVPWEHIGYHMGARLDQLLRGKPRKQSPPLVGPGAVITRSSSDTYAITNPAVAKACIYLRAQAGNAIGVADAARAVGVSRRSLERQFRKTLGRSPLKELRRVRLELARELLRDSAYTLAYIAHHTGFGTSQRFSTVFKAMTGQTPGAYRIAVQPGSAR